MDFLADTIIGANDRIPGMAFRARERDGRLKRPFRMLLTVAGAAAMTGGGAVIRLALRGFDNGDLNLFLTTLIGLAGVMLLAGGLGCATRGLRNPPPPALPDNVIPLYDPSRAPTRYASGSTRPF